MLSVVGIMRNESARVDTWLEALKEFIAKGGDVVVIDTGSSDDTVEKLKKQGVRVVIAEDMFNSTLTQENISSFNKWVGSECMVSPPRPFFEFGPAHNFASSKARHNYVLHLDAGDVVTRFDVDTIVSKLKPKCMFEYSHEIGSSEAIQSANRLFDKRAYHYMGRAHEFITDIDPLCPGNRERLNTDVLTVRYTRVMGKQRPYLEPMYKDLLENPWSRVYFYIGRELYYAAHWNEALRVFTESYEKYTMQWNEERSQMCVFAGECAANTHDYTTALQWVAKALSHCSYRREPYLLLAEIMLLQRNNTPALAFVNAALTIPRPGPGLFERADNYFERPSRLAIVACSRIENISELRKHVNERSVSSYLHHHTSLNHPCREVISNVTSKYNDVTCVGDVNNIIHILYSAMRKVPKSVLRVRCADIALIRETGPIFEENITVYANKTNDLLKLNAEHCLVVIIADLLEECLRFWHNQCQVCMILLKPDEEVICNFLHTHREWLRMGQNTLVKREHVNALAKLL